MERLPITLDKRGDRVGERSSGPQKSDVVLPSSAWSESISGVRNSNHRGSQTSWIAQSQSSTPVESLAPNALNPSMIP